MKVKFTYKDGSEEIIDGVLSNSVVMDEDGSGAFFMKGDCFTHYHFEGLESFTEIDEVSA